MTTTRGAVHEGVGADPAVALRRADGLQLLGQMEGSGYRVPPFMVRRSDGQFLHLTRVLYLVLEATDGRRSVAQVAAAVSAEYGRTVSPANVDSLVSGKLRPLGLLTTADGRQPALKRSNPLLGLRFRVSVTDETWTRRLTQPFGVFFRPFAWVPVVAAFVAVCWWVFLEKGLASATYEAFEHPGLLVLVFVITVLSAGFHEFGHAAAARYGGAVPGVMGAGVYLVWPAFYTDVTDSYRLDRRGRLRTDLGGLYFNAIVAVGITGAWLLSGYDALLLVVAAQIVQMLGQLLPLVRFDGYHVLADLTGVPDLFHRITPTLLGVLPWRWRDPEARMLKRWARAVVTLWVFTVVPVLAFVLVLLVLTLPRVVATAWAKLAVEQDRLAAAWGDGELLQSTARVLTILGVVLPVLAVVLMLARVVHQAGRGVWRRTADRPLQRVLAIVTAVALVAGLVWAWWPDGGTYRPIQPDEKGTLVSAVPDTSRPDRPRPPVEGSAGLAEGDRGAMVATWDTQEPMPTEAEPELALVLVPQKGDPTLASSGVELGWVFPFSQPLVPGPGDNQALSINTEDGTTEYDVAISLVWVEDEEPSLNTNEAYAFASCSHCASVAVAFQVVLVVGDNDTAVPQNLAVAVNSDCLNCLTYALAQQLFLTLEEPLSAEAMAALDELWAQVAGFAHDIESYDLSELDNQLDAFVDQILAIIEADQPGPLGTTDPTPTGTQSPTADASPTGSTDESPTAPSPSETPVSPVPEESSTTVAPTTGEPTGTAETGDAATP